MSKPLIAVIDDEQDLLDNFESLLSDQFEIRTFSSAQAFLQAFPELLQSQLKLVITDFKMPKMNGLEMIKKAYETQAFPFIILSGHLDKQTVMNAVEMGVFRLLEKPTNHEELSSTIDQLLMEADLVEVRQEIRMITSQLRELYSTIRIALMQHIPEDMLDRLVVDAPQGQVKKSMSFEDLLEKLEHRLEVLLVSENMMSELRQNKWKASS